MHYLALPYALALALHAPAAHVAWLVGIPVVVYAMDFAYGLLGRTFLVPTSRFTRMDAGVDLTFKHPKGFDSDGTGYVQVRTQKNLQIA